MGELVPLQRVFEYEGSKVRTAVKDGVPLLCGKDVCDVLEIANDRDALARLDEDEKGVVLTDTLGGPQEMAFVTEAGLYCLILTSRKPEAKRFKRWATHEVLPAIRKTGYYDPQGRRLPQNYVEALEELITTEKDRLALADRVDILEPKGAVYDAAMSAKNALTMAQVAKSLGWGRNNLFRELKGRGILMSDTQPYQNQIDCGRFVVRVTPITMGGQTVDKTQTLVTPKGLDYLCKTLKTTSLVKRG